MKNYYLYVMIATLCTGCIPDLPKRYPQPGWGKETTDQIVYVKDERTNICYATTIYGTDSKYSVLTTVECTPQVEALLAQ